MEPRLEDIGDYDTLKGEKKKIVWSVIIVGILIGVAFAIAYKVFNDKGDAIPIKDTIGVVPMSKSIPVR